MDEYKPNNSSTSDSHDVELFAVGKEEENLKYLILNHVERSAISDIFGAAGDGDYMDEVVCVDVGRILSSLQTDPLKQEACCNEMIRLLSTERRNLLALDRIITKIIFYAQEEGIISLLLACQVLVSSIDFQMSIPLNPAKINFVRERMHHLDYKNMRDLLKLLLVEKLDKMQTCLTEYQHKQLALIEELMIDLIDRKANFCPALFFITEISRISPQSPIHFLPRVSLKIREMVASFRPLAEIGSMIGRSWMYPITMQPCFSWLHSTFHTWKLQEQNYRLHFRTHLPYSNENMAPQTYLQYVLLKQPRGQDNLTFIIKQSNSHSTPRLQCSEVIQILILEAMCAMEDSELPVLTPTNQYNWLHLCHLITYALTIGCCTLQQLLPMLQIHLKNYQYHKAKGELMWILLQFISLVKVKSSSMSTLSKNQLDTKNRDLVLEIFNLLYPEEMVWAGCSTDFLNMVRFFAPASLWINLSQLAGCSSSMPPQKVQQHIEFFKSQLKLDTILENGVLAVIANAYSNNLEIFETHVSRAILRMLGAGADFQQVQLPYGRKADGCLKALDLALLDAFTFHAKKMLYTSLLSYLQSHTQNEMLPSPALIETICRIIMTTEWNDNGKTFFTFFTHVCKETQNTDLLAICMDMLNYRLQGVQLNYQYRVHLICYVIEQMCAISTSGSSLHRAIYAKMEQTIMRQILIMAPLDFAQMACYFSNKSVFINLFVPPESFGDYRQYGWHACPEISRMFLLNLFRCHKVIASPTSYILTDVNFDYMSLSRQSYQWASSTVKWFPIPFEVDSDMTKLLASIRKNDADSEQEVRSFSMNADDFPANYQKVTLFISVFKSIYTYSFFPLCCYKILASMNSRDLILNTNAFIDFIVWKSQKTQEYEKLITVVNEMIFVKNCIPFERFLLALVLHPNDDTSIEYSLLLLSSLIKQFPSNHFSQRIHSYCAFAPLYSNTAYTKSEDYFVKLFDYYKKYPESTYLELMKSNVSSENFCEPEKHLPVYYDNVPERILPVIDVLLQRSLEIAINPQILTTFLTTFSPLYKFHPQPMTFLYKTLYSLDGLGTFTHTPIARQFVMEIVQKIEDDRSSKYIVLSQEFFINDHKMPIVRFCQTLVDRIIAASTYLHRPPSFVVRDWRFAEYPPAAQALTGAWIELMASPHSAKDITDGIMELAMRRPIHRPYDTINAIGLLLTGLPRSFQNVFFDRIMESFDWPQMLNEEPSILFESFSQEVYLYSESRVLTMLALVHSFCQHAGNNSLSVLPDLIADQLAPKVQNETQLIYFLRILVPFLQRINDKEKQRHMNEYLKPILSIYNMLNTLVEKIGTLKYEDTICDLLYQFKYMFVGYSLKDKTESLIEKFPKSMREKLKFLSSSATDSLHHQQQQQQEQQQQQSHHHYHQQQMIVGHQSQLIHSHLGPFAVAGNAAVPPNHPMFLAAAGMLTNINLSMSLQQQQQLASSHVQQVLMVPSVAPAIPFTPSQIQSSSMSSALNNENNINMNVDGMVHPIHNTSSSNMSNSSIMNTMSDNINVNNDAIGSSIGDLKNSVMPNQVSKLLSSASIPAQMSNTNELPPPPPYSQIPLTNMNLAASASQTTTMAGSQFPAMGMGNLGSIPPNSTSAGMMMSGMHLISGIPPTGMMNRMPSLPFSNANFVGGSGGAEFMRGGIHMGAGMPPQTASQFHPQMMSQMHADAGLMGSGVPAPSAAGFTRHAMNFPSSSSIPSQMFMPGAQVPHMQTPASTNSGHVMHPHMTMHPSMQHPMAPEAFHRQQMQRFPSNNQMM